MTVVNFFKYTFIVIDKKLLLLLFKNGHNYAQIGRIMGFSRQRVHLLLVGYKKKNIIIDQCVICRQKASTTYAINKKKSKVIKICSKCDYLLNGDSITKKIIKTRKVKKWSRYYLKCELCNDTKYSYRSIGLCSKCYNSYNYARKKLKEENLF